MNKQISVFVLVAILGLQPTSEALARGGARGGGGGMARGGGGGFSGGGMASRPSPSIGRSPSMSRPSMPSSNRPSMGTGVGSRPSAGGPAVSTRPSVGGPGVGTRPGASGPGVGTRPGASGPGVGTRPGAGGPGPAGRPSAGDLQGFLNIGPSTGAIGGGAATRPGSGNLGAIGGGAAAAFLQGGGANGRPGASQLPAGGRLDKRGDIADNRGDIVDSRTDRVTARTDARSDWATHRPDRVENRQQLQENRFQRRDEIRNQVQENHPRLDFWSDYPGWAAMRITRPYRWATWGAVTGWVSYGWTQPVSYSYGETVYYEGDTVYQGDQVIATTVEYTQQAETIVSSAPEIAPAEAEWLPLGVFALSPDGQASGPAPSLFLQLAISKEGVLRGTLNNTATGKTQEIEGMTDKASQRSAWTVADQSWPIMETGISNLTQDTAPALVHFADGQTQQWLMVRLADPSGQE